MTRDAFKNTVWQWQCDVCLKYYGTIEVSQSKLPDLGEMVDAGWSIGQLHGDACPKCVADGKTPNSERWVKPQVPQQPPVMHEVNDHRIFGVPERTTQ